MMNEFEQAKKEYEQIPVPEELADRVQAGIRQGRAKRMQRKWKRGAGAVAACLVLVVGTLNISPTVAAAAADVPVLGGLFQILTVRSYQDTNEDRTVEVEQPAFRAAPWPSRSRRRSRSVWTPRSLRARDHRPVQGGVPGHRRHRGAVGGKGQYRQRHL